MRTTCEAVTKESLRWKKVAAAIGLSVTCLLTLHADNRILIPAKINGQSVRMIFDSGASHSGVFRSAAVRLGLKIDEPSSPPPKLHPGEVPVRTADCQLTVGTATHSASLAIIDSAILLDCDGWLAWDNFRSNIVEVVADKNEVKFLDKLPKGTMQWPHWKLVDRSEDDHASMCLGFEIPRKGAKRSVVFIDTGWADGIRLSSARFKEWVGANASAPVTLGARYSLPDGLVVEEEYWATRLDLSEGLQLRNVPITKCVPSDETIQGFEATLGLFALTRLKVIVDGAKNTIYLQPIANPAAAYAYNRIGAVFTPRDIRGGDLIARVVRGGPAHEAGIREGDILTKIGDLDATKWQTDPRILPLGRFWKQPAGNQVQLSCLRGEKTFSATITLKEIFPGAVPSGSPSNGIKR